MKTFTTKLKLLTAVGVISTSAFAQGDMSTFLQAGANDGTKILNAYASPLLKSFGAGLNGGWFNSAKVHGIGGFSLTVSPNIAFAPAADQEFNVNALGLSSSTRVINGKTVSPTIFGASEDANNPEIGMFARYPGATQDSMLTSFKLPPGIGVNLFPVPTAQLAVGVGLGTEVAIRFLPTIKSGEFEIGMFGFAVKHDIKQWFKGIKEMPFDLSVMAGYTQLDASLKLKELKGDPESSQTHNPNPGKAYNQSVEFTSSAYTFNAIISKKLSVFTPYLGLGFQGATTKLGLKGDYPLTDLNSTYDPNQPTTGSNKPKTVKELKDPVNLEGSIGGFRATAGFRLKLAVITIHADYTFAEYNVASIGIGLHLQSIAPFKL
ncbi:MAG: hypothetical protein KBG11_10050 [Bacteroidia bacterium]|nr:hypothetical protein [Bacteroidia bacterium]